MTAISSTSFGLLDRIGASRSSYIAPSSALTPKVRQSAAVELSSRVTLGTGNNNPAVYSDPSAKPGVARLWASPVGKEDSVSALMARNRGTNARTLGDQWRGLGGALLTGFAKTGDNYTQALADAQPIAEPAGLDAPTPEAQAQRAAEILAKQTAALADLSNGAPAAGLKLQTRSGQSVELRISISTGRDGTAGLGVELKASGAMSPTERAAIEQLADGLDRALEGLGRGDAVGLDLSGLMNYDREALASVDLTASNSQPGQVLSTFSLHLGDDKRSISLKGREGDLDLNVAPDMPLSTPPQQSATAIQQTLDRLDDASDRGHANKALVKQMKSAFRQFQVAATTDAGNGPEGSKDTTDALVAPAAETAKPAPADSARPVKPLPKTLPGAIATTATSAATVPAPADTASPLSGLADFDASFSGATTRANRFGATAETGRVDYQLSQKTTTKEGGTDRRSVAQTVSERLSADYLTAADTDRMLDTQAGDYAATAVRDSRTVTTLIDSAADRALRVLRNTDEQQNKTVTDFENRQSTHSQSWPSQRSLIERLH